MQKLNPIALANTLAIIDLILHPLFHFWVWASPHSYVWVMNLFVAGLTLNVTSFDSSLFHITLGTLLEVTVFWVLGYSAASLYNRLGK